MLSIEERLDRAEIALRQAVARRNATALRPIKTVHDLDARNALLRQMDHQIQQLQHLVDTLERKLGAALAPIRIASRSPSCAASTLHFLSGGDPELTATHGGR